MDPHNINKATIGAFRSALYDFDRGRLTSVVKDVFDPGCAVHLANPVEDLDGPGALLDQAFFPLADAIPDLERRDTIVIAGNALGQDWVGCGGYYTGLFERLWLKIPQTRHQISLGFHEFYRMEGGGRRDAGPLGHSRGHDASAGLADGTQYWSRMACTGTGYAGWGGRRAI